MNKIKKKKGFLIQYLKKMMIMQMVKN